MSLSSADRLHLFARRTSTK